MARAEVEAMLLQNGKQALPVVWVPPRRVDDYRRQVRPPPPPSVTLPNSPQMKDTKLKSPAGVCTRRPSTHPSS